MPPPKFPYSPAYTHANFVWDAPHLDAYLANPASVLPEAPLYQGGK
jgi:cytochrome c2